MNRIQLKQSLYKSLFKAAKGYIIWHRLIKKHPEIQNTLVILMPTNNKDDNTYALKYLNQLLDKSGRSNAVILTHDNDILKKNKELSDGIINIIFFARKKALCLMQYATLDNFDNRLYIASLDEPYGRFGSRLIDVNSLSREDVFAFGVYGCRNRSLSAHCTDF